MDMTRMDMMLDRIREEQIQQGALLQDIAERQQQGQALLRATLKAVRSRPAEAAKAVTIPWGAISTALQCAATLGLTVWLVKSGIDPAVVAPILKAVGAG